MNVRPGILISFVVLILFKPSFAFSETGYLSLEIYPLDTPRIAVFNGLEEIVPEGEIRILSWNIKILPWITGPKNRIGAQKRAKIIPLPLIDDLVDVIIFQEAFDNRIAAKLRKALRKTFPYQTRQANRVPGFKTNSGVMILSKYPLTELGSVDFTDCEKEDCWAHKGALLVEIELPGQIIQVLGTHLEAGGGPVIKTNQYKEIKGLTDLHQKSGIPQLLCGDFNTHVSDKELYQTMLSTLDASDGPISGEIKYTAGKYQNDLFPVEKRKEIGEVIDFILYRGQGIQPSSMERFVRIYKIQWHPQHENLSDHHAVLMKIRF